MSQPLTEETGLEIAKSLRRLVELLERPTQESGEVNVVVNFEGTAESLEESLERLSERIEAAASCCWMSQPGLP